MPEDLSVRGKTMSYRNYAEAQRTYNKHGVHFEGLAEPTSSPPQQVPASHHRTFSPHSRFNDHNAVHANQPLMRTFSELPPRSRAEELIDMPRLLPQTSRLKEVEAKVKEEKVEEDFDKQSSPPMVCFLSIPIYFTVQLNLFQKLLNMRVTNLGNIQSVASQTTVRTGFRSHSLAILRAKSAFAFPSSLFLCSLLFSPQSGLHQLCRQVPRPPQTKPAEIHHPRY
jgi:hypothetical protein